MSTIIIYNPRLGERESRTSRIRRSRKRPLGEAASSSSSILGRKKRRWWCGCVVATARIFSSATGQKPCTIPAQQHRPQGSQNQKEAASPAEAEQVQYLSSLCVFLPLALSIPPSQFFFLPHPLGGREPTRGRFGGCSPPVEISLWKRQKPDERSASRAL